MKKSKSIDVKKLVIMATLTAIVVVLQLLASFLPGTVFKFTLSLVPIVIGAALIGPLAGAWLGFAFAFVVLMSSPDVAVFMAFDPLVTICLILLRGILAGLTAGFIYKLHRKIGKTLAVALSAALCPIVNTGLLVLGLYVFFLPLLESWGITDVTAYIFLTLVGINFIIEFAINLVLSPVIVRLIQYGQETAKITE